MTRLRALAAFAALTAYVGCGGLAGVDFDGAHPREDAGNDAPTESDRAAGSSFCATATHTFCFDFDEGSAVKDWSSSDSKGSLLDLDPAHYVSAPAGVRMQTPNVGADAGLDAAIDAVRSSELDLTISRTVAAFHFAFDFRIAACEDRDVPLQLGGVQTESWSAALLYYPKDGRADWITSSSSEALPRVLGPLARETWMHFDADVALTDQGISSRLGLRANGGTEAGISFDDRGVVAQPELELAFSIGISPTDPVGCDVTFDNVTFDVLR
jgi:hypothetical protein